MWALDPLRRPRLAVRAVVAQRVPDVDGGERPRRQRDLLALEPARVAARRPTARGGRRGCPGRARGRRTGPGDRRRSPGWRRMTAHSSSVSGPGLSRIESGTPILPMSWSRAPRRMWGISASSTPERPRQVEHHRGDPAAVLDRLAVAEPQRAGQPVDDLVAGRDPPGPGSAGVDADAAAAGHRGLVADGFPRGRPRVRRTG